MAEQNFSVAVRMTMEKVVDQYLQSFAKYIALKRRNKASRRKPAQTIEVWPSRFQRAAEAMDPLNPR
jgi:hypothetical protein